MSVNDSEENDFPITPRVQKRWDIVKKLFYEEPTADRGEGMTVLNEETAKFPIVIRKALAIKKVLTEMPVVVGEEELIVGCAIMGSPTNGAPFPEYATPEERKAANDRFTDVYSVPGHFCPYYPRYMELGLNGLREFAERKLEQVRRWGREPEKQIWYEAVLISLNGLKELITRHGDYVKTLADSEADPARSKEWLKISGICKNLVERAPQTFHEALQAFWFAHIAFQSTLEWSSIGRFDQYMWPFLKHDLENGIITMAEAQELVDLIWLKFNERMRGREVEGINYYAEDRKGGYGYIQFFQTMALSGLTPEGEDGTNPMTWLCLNSILRFKTVEPDCYVRFHDGSPNELYEKVAECHRAGCSQPSIYNDEFFVPNFVESGFPVEVARDYSSDGCWEPYPQGRSYFSHREYIIVEALERLIHPASWDVAAMNYIEKYYPFAEMKAPDSRALRSFEEVMGLFKKYLEAIIRKVIESVDEYWDGRLYDIAPDPLLSAFMLDPLERGRDMTLGGADYFVLSILGVGFSHVVDSLAVIKQLCFDEKTVEWNELVDAVQNNWDGRESLRQLVRTRVPAYGNDNEYTDGIAVEVSQFIIETIKKYSAMTTRNIKFLPGLATFSMHIWLGSKLRATPDGRFTGDSLSSNATPSVGRMLRGQTAAVNSYAKATERMAGGAALDLAFPSQPGAILQLEAFIKSFVERRGGLLTISVNDVNTLKAAQKEPEKYRDLKIRIGGFEGYFTDLDRLGQDWQIAKLEQYG